MTVGQSHRTTGKHALQNAINGRENAVAHRIRRRYLMIDLCAGNGAPSKESGTSSPAIMLKHRDYARQKLHRADDQVRVALIEKDYDTYLELKKNHPTADHALYADARDIAALVEPLWDRQTCVFILNDPNNVHQWALTAPWVTRLPRLTTTMSTLGCNVGGLKMLKPEKREEWFHHVGCITATLSDHQDALLISLTSDSNQWAYLISGPERWREEYQRDAEKAFQGHDLETAWASDHKHFDDLTNRLFRTRKEYQHNQSNGGLF